MLTGIQSVLCKMISQGWDDKELDKTLRELRHQIGSLYQDQNLSFYCQGKLYRADDLTDSKRELFL